MLHALYASNARFPLVGETRAPVRAACVRLHEQRLNRVVDWVLGRRAAHEVYQSTAQALIAAPPRRPFRPTQGASPRADATADSNLNRRPWQILSSLLPYFRAARARCVRTDISVASLLPTPVCSRATTPSRADQPCACRSSPNPNGQWVATRSCGTLNEGSRDL